MALHSHYLLHDSEHQMTEYFHIVLCEKMKEKYTGEKAILEWKDALELAQHNHHSVQEGSRKTEKL